MGSDGTETVRKKKRKKKIKKRRSGFVDREGTPLALGMRVKYYPYENRASAGKHGTKFRMGTVLYGAYVGQCVDVILDGDPFGTYVQFDRVEATEDSEPNHPLLREMRSFRKSGKIHPADPAPGKTRKDTEGQMAKTETKKQGPSARELRREAKALDIKGWEDMAVADLQAAVKAASKKNGKKAASKTSKTTGEPKTTTKAKKGKKADKPAKAAKATREPREVAENGNPYKEGDNLWWITEEILKGGKRSGMVKRLQKRIEIKPRDGRTLEGDDLVAEIDRRILITGQILRNKHGWDVTREGRGGDATIVGTPPS